MPATRGTADGGFGRGRLVESSLTASFPFVEDLVESTDGFGEVVGSIDGKEMTRTDVRWTIELGVRVGVPTEKK